MKSSVRLPDAIQVLERGWLSANNVLLFDGEQVTLIDSGYVSHAEQTIALLRHLLKGKTVVRLINTHSHSDHTGGNAAVQQAFGCTISVPEGMAEAVSQWDEAALMLSLADQSSAPFAYDDLIMSGMEIHAGETVWQALPAPGHDMDALVYYSPDRRILISGDALWRDGFGILFSEIFGQSDGLKATRQTLETIARLNVEYVIPGHGAPFVEVDQALTAAFARLDAFEADGTRIARNAIRACIAFTLLDQRKLALECLPQYLEETPLYRVANARFLGWTSEKLANWLVEELERVGVARREAGYLVTG